MRCVVLGMRNAVRCEIWCYGDMVIWPALATLQSVTSIRWTQNTSNGHYLFCGKVFGVCMFVVL